MTVPTCEDVPKPMRIVKGEKLAGVPLENVRNLLRRCAHSIIDIDAVAHVLRLDKTDAKRLTRALVRAGYIRKCESSRQPQPVEYERTIEGSALASATMTRPLRRSTVERLLKEVIERARSINASDAYAYRVAQIALFGSALTDKERPSDVDLAVTLAPRHTDRERQQIAEHARVRVAVASGRRFSDVADLFWPQTEVLLALRGRARGISLQDSDAPTRLRAKSKIVFRCARRSAPRAK